MWGNFNCHVVFEHNKSGYSVGIIIYYHLSLLIYFYSSLLNPLIVAVNLFSFIMSLLSLGVSES